jgi:protein-L-isoaspartate O-methyltransferase
LHNKLGVLEVGESLGYDAAVQTECVTNLTGCLARVIPDMA